MNAVRRALAIALLLLAAGCSLDSNPLYQPGTWHPTGANDVNLRAMVADPADLAGRRTTGITPAPLAVGAIARMNTDKVKPLHGGEASPGFGAAGGGGLGGGAAGGGGGGGGS